MYWRIRKVGPNQFLSQWGVHLGLGLSLLANVVLITTRPDVHKLVGQGTRMSFDQFVRNVTTQLLDSSYVSYESNTLALLGGELAPSVKQKLMQAGELPKSMEEVKATVRGLTDKREVAAVHIQEVNQGDPNEQGLIPIDVKGIVAVHSADESGPTGPVPFHFRYLVGQNSQTQQPIVAAIQEAN